MNMKKREKEWIDQVDRSKGMETLITEDLTKIKSTDLLRLSKDTVCRNRILCAERKLRILVLCDCISCLL